MCLFKKTPPNVCPKCGRADGWRIVPFEEPATPDDGLYHASGASVRGPFGASPHMKAQVRKAQVGKVRYQCSNCGFQKSF